VTTPQSAIDAFTDEVRAALNDFGAGSYLLGWNRGNRNNDHSAEAIAALTAAAKSYAQAIALDVIGVMDVVDDRPQMVGESLVQGYSFAHIRNSLRAKQLAKLEQLTEEGE